jgi:hypothetical protein
LFVYEENGYAGGVGGDGGPGYGVGVVVFPLGAVGGAGDLDGWMGGLVRGRGGGGGDGEERTESGASCGEQGEDGGELHYCLCVFQGKTGRLRS